MAWVSTGIQWLDLWTWCSDHWSCILQTDYSGSLWSHDIFMNKLVKKKNNKERKEWMNNCVCSETQLWRVKFIYRLTSPQIVFTLCILNSRPSVAAAFVDSSLHLVAAPLSAGDCRKDHREAGVRWFNAQCWSWNCCSVFLFPLRCGLILLWLLLSTSPCWRWCSWGPRGGCVRQISWDITSPLLHLQRSFHYICL